MSDMSDMVDTRDTRSASNASNASNEAVARGWLNLSARERQQLVRGVMYAEDPPVKLTELLALVHGKHGQVLQERFVDTLSSGMQFPRTKSNRCYSWHCVVNNNLAPLQALVDGYEGVRVGFAHQSVTRSQWLDMLSTHKCSNGVRITTTMFVQALSFPDGKAKATLAFALVHQPEHPDIETVLGLGGRKVALLTEALMLRRRQGAACPAGQIPSAPSTRQRSRRSARAV